MGFTPDRKPCTKPPRNNPPLVFSRDFTALAVKKMPFSLVLLVHLVAFAAYIGAGFAQLQLLKRSRRARIGAELRDGLERLSAAIVTKIELPAIVGAIASGVGFVVLNPAVMRFGWLHAKLACVVLLAVLSHLEMFNARAIVKAREAKASEDGIDARKKRHEAYGAVGSLLVVVLLVLVTVVRLG
jgi:uncharacterized membrane protein